MQKSSFTAAIFQSKKQSPGNICPPSDGNILRGVSVQPQPKAFLGCPKLAPGPAVPGAGAPSSSRCRPGKRCD